MKRILNIAAVFVLALSGKTLSAQIDVNNTGIVYINSTTDTFSVSGIFRNTGSAALTNNGIIQLTRDLVNDQASMATGSGTLILNGSTTQIVSGSQKFSTNNLITSNASGITLNNDLSVSAVHTYASGMITTSATPNYMIYEAGSSYTGSNDSRHVNGWVKKLGNTNFIFPVGNAVYLRSVALNNIAASSEFNVRHNNGATPNQFSLFNPLVLVDAAEYWTINKISGTSAQVAMNWDNSKIPFPNLMLTDIRATYFDGVFWRSIGGSASGSSMTTGNLTSNSVTAFNTNFTFGSVSYVLPLKIISFTARQMNGYTKLNWTIGNELNVDKYELQRSDDGINFYAINVQSPYNLNVTEFYSFDDNKALKSKTFYRLKVNNLSTQVNYSHIVTVSANDNGKAFYVITNPVDASIDIYADAALKGVYNYTIASTSGQVMQTGKLDIRNTGIYSIHLKSVFAKGAYILVVENETNRLQKTIIKK